MRPRIIPIFDHKKLRENRDEGLKKARNKKTIEINSILTNGDLLQKIGAKEITRKTKKNVIPNEKFDGSLFKFLQKKMH